VKKRDLNRARTTAPVSKEGGGGLRKLKKKKTGRGVVERPSRATLEYQGGGFQNGEKQGREEAIERLGLEIKKGGPLFTWEPISFLFTPDGKEKGNPRERGERRRNSSLKPNWKVLVKAVRKTLTACRDRRSLKRDPIRDVDRSLARKRKNLSLGGGAKNPAISGGNSTGVSWGGETPGRPSRWEGKYFEKGFRGPKQ